MAKRHGSQTVNLYEAKTRLSELVDRAAAGEEIVWWRANDPSLHRDAPEAIADSDGAFVSAASAWEVAIRIALGKLRIPGPFAAAVEASRFGELAITFQHATRAGALPAHHSDPFDRMLVAQAISENLTLVTHDRAFSPYGVAVIWI